MPRAFAHRHLLDIERLSVAEIETILNRAEQYIKSGTAVAKKTSNLAGKTLVNLFFEPSTRTRTSFEIAAKRLGIEVVNIATEHSSTKKGETLLDTVQNLDAMHVDALVIRHSEDGVPQFIAPHLKASVINAGDGKHEHPTQALVDALVIRRHKKKLKGLTVAYIGDIQHSRVARSNIHLLNKFGAKMRIIVPPYFMPQDIDKLGVEVFDNLKEGLRGADVVITQRIQLERLGEGEFAVSLKEYHKTYGLNHDKLKDAKKDVIVLNPGPVIRNVEITSELADDPKYSVIREQVELGVALKMAVLELLLTAKKK
jgi:aspartate carbamoyltransferase catalytic subunit